MRKLQGHFFSAQKDVDLIITSADKITKRGSRIEALELGPTASAKDDGLEERELEPSVPPLGSGQLRLRVVDE